MVGSRTATAAVGFVASVLVSAAAWVYLGTPVLLFFLPFVPILLRRSAESRDPPERECPRCGYRTRDQSFEYCPRDGTRLE